ncbi:MAG: serine hydrolase [Gaiellaceae bacterium]
MDNIRVLRRAACAAAALGLLGGVGAAAASVDTGRVALTGRIAYNTAGGDIWVTNANGTCRHQVSESGAGTDYDPSWAPNGQQVVFSSDRGRSHSDPLRAGLDSMFVINVDGTHEREIEPHSGAEFPAWSPARTKIAFAGLRATGQEMTIYTINPNGTELHDLGLPGNSTEPTWSHDAKEIAYTSGTQGKEGIWIVDATGRNPRQLTYNATDSLGAWSPDNSELVYSSGEGAQRELYVVPVQGGTPRRISNFPGSDSADAWLPNGRIIFVHFRGDTPAHHYYTVRPDGSDRQTLALVAGNPIDWLPRKTPDRACHRRVAKKPPLRLSLKQLIAPLIRGKHKPPGAVAYILDHGRHARAAVGYAKAETHAPMAATARFRIGSVSKTFTAVTVLQLVAEGKLHLSDTVERWLPGLLPSGKEITIRELLNHTSGLYDYVRDPNVRTTWGTDHVPPPRRLIAIAASHGLDFSPGTRWEYSSTNYQVLGMLIERVSGHSLAAELKRRIFRPLRLNATALVPGRDIPGPHANSYYVYSNGRRLNETRTTFGAWADGAIVSNAPDLARFYRALLGGKLLSRTLLSQLKRTVSTAGSQDGEASGLGIFRISLACGKTWGHTGGAAGYLTKVLASANGKRVVVVATNGFVDEGAITQPLLDATATTAYCGRVGRD